MKLRPISDEFFAYAMRDVTGVRFERLAKQVFASIQAFATSMLARHFRDFEPARNGGGSVL